jgi:glutamate--cysteine ligase
MIPHLTTALTGPLQELEKRVLESSTTIEHWFRTQWQEHTPPFYSSVDLRNSGFKIAPVDTNLYPGGFNNLNPAFVPLCVQAAMSAIEKICPDAKNLLLIPENHTRNQFYLRNVGRLSRILRQAGLNVRLGSLNPEIKEPTQVEVEGGTSLLLEPLVRHGRRLGLADFDPCTILLNNDLSSGIPDILKDLHEQFLLPPLHAGWAVRRKSHHFAAYDDVVKEFARVLSIDPWLVNPYFAVCGEVNFHERAGEECLTSNVDALLIQIRAKYLEYGIKETPYVVVKADAGTYGMGIMTARDASEVKGLNRKQRNKMSVVKEGLEVTEVIMQEGVHTYERVNEASAEPVVYMVDRYVVGGFYRLHNAKGNDGVLNAPGMEFMPLAFDESCTTPDHTAQPGAGVNRFYTYGVVARLAALAAAVELERTDPAAEQ